MALLYHCFPRKKKRPDSSSAKTTGGIDDPAEWNRAKAIFTNILDDGLYLTEEVIHVPWDDPFGNHKSKDTDVTQHRFCLTSLSSEEDLRGHCGVFGAIGLGFGLDEVRQLGGFPVFYLPSPSATPSRTADRLNFTGVSLLYRLAEIRSVLEAVGALPPILRRQLLDKVWDFENMLGALRFFGNMLYFTDYLKEHDAVELRYYKQREWRIIAGLGDEKAMTEEIQFNQAKAHALRALGDQPVQNLIQEVIICGTPEQKEELEDQLQSRKLQTPVRLIPP